MSQAIEQSSTSAPQSMSRRAALVGASALAGSVVNLSAITASRPAEADPIFAAIERHRALYIQDMASGAVRSELRDGTPEWYDADAIHMPLHEAAKQAGIELTQIMPTTLAGVLALLAYVDEFNARKVVLPSDPGWHSYADGWPIDFDISIGDDGDCEQPFAWFLMRNVANALRSIEAVQS